MHEFEFSGASYWIVDRISASGHDWSPVMALSDGSTHNIINRVRIEDMGYGVEMKSGADYNVVQNSLIGNMRMSAGSDAVCVELDGTLVRGTRIVNNELYNCNDAAQLVGPRTGGRSYPDTILAHNEMYLTSEFYSDCNGNRDPDGECACAENAIDVKVGSNEPDHPVRIIGNIMWGWRKTDEGCGGSGSWGSIVVVHFDVQNLEVRDNVFYNGPRGFVAADITVALSDITIENNLFHSMGENSLDTASGRALILYGDNVSVYGNTIIDTVSSISLSGENGHVEHNVFINAGPGGVYSSVSADYNRYYNTPQLDATGSHDEVYDTAEESGYTERCFNVRRWTDPETICLEYSTPPSP